MSAPFSVRSERVGQVHRLTPVGDLDLATVPLLEREFDAAYSPDETVVMLVDLTELAFIDSSGLKLLLQMHARCPHRMRVINGSPAVERLFDVAGVRDSLPIIDNNADPLAPPP
jgi:anti-sigma B factor antagonist